MVPRQLRPNTPIDKCSQNKCAPTKAPAEISLIINLILLINKMFKNINIF